MKKHKYAGYMYIVQSGIPKEDMKYCEKGYDCRGISAEGII